MNRSKSINNQAVYDDHLLCYVQVQCTHMSATPNSNRFMATVKPSQFLLILDSEIGSVTFSIAPSHITVIVLNCQWIVQLWT